MEYNSASRFHQVFYPRCTAHHAFTCDKFIEVAEEQLKKNRDLVRATMKLRSEDTPKNGVPLIRAQSDVAYNNPPKGRFFSQRGTQAWAPCFAAEPGLENTDGIQNKNQGD